MATALDVARYIGIKHPELVRRDAATQEKAKLQKLLYYVQAWHLVWHGVPLFGEVIQAWKRGPVCPDVYIAQKEGRAGFDAAPRLSTRDCIVIDRVLDLYGHRSGSELSELTHREDPWRNARHGLAHDDPAQPEISIVAMQRYFENLASSAEERAIDLSVDEVENWIDASYTDVMRRLAR